jgi:hypothetical protein
MQKSCPPEGGRSFFMPSGINGQAAHVIGGYL